jgi:hypothetical protein
MAIVRQWEVFQVGPGGDPEELHVTMGRKGEILIGAKAFEKMGKPEAVELLFDKVSSVIGLSPSSLRQANAYPCKQKPNAKYRIVRANRFCRHYGIKVDRTVRFNKPEIGSDRVLALDLRATTGVGKARPEIAP